MPKKTATVEEQFESIAERAIEEAEQVNCPFPEFVDGLKSIAQELMDHWSLAKSELRSKHDGREKEE